MATSSSPTPSSQASTNTTEVSDCPQCGSVCVGAFLLPCGHLVCRKCLRDHHGFQLTCSICNQSLTLPRSKGPEDFTSLVQQLGVDPVMVKLVVQRLRGQGRQSCVACVNRDATSLCHDCNEQYCDGCAKGHRRQGRNKDHVLQTLPQALLNTSSAACAVSRPRTDSTSSTDSLESIRNPMDQPTSRGQSRGTKQWKQWVKQQVGLLQAALSEQDTAVTSLTDVMSRVQKLLAEAQARQQLLQTFVQSLPSLAVTEHSDVDTFNVTFNDDDVSMPVKTGTLQNRLNDVIHQQQSSYFASDVTSLIVILQDLLSKCGAAIKSSQVSRPKQQSGTSPTPQPVTTQQSGTSPTPQLVTTQQSGTSPTPQPVTTQQSGTSPTQPALPSPSTPASSPSSQHPSNVLPTYSPAFQGQRAARSWSQGPSSRAAPTTLTPTTDTTSSTTVDPIKATPRRAFTMTPACDGDEDNPDITSIVSIEGGQRLIMLDRKNKKVKVVDMGHPHDVSASLTLNEQPFSVAVLPDTLIAVTTYNKVIYQLKVTNTVTVTSRITTKVEYHGIAGHSDGNLIVSVRVDKNFHIDYSYVARIDILSRSGRVVRTIADSHSLTQLCTPHYLYLMDNHVYVSDFMSDAVFKVDLNTGQLLDTMTHTELRSPRQITADTSGHLYIASWDSHAVLVRSPSGQWRKLVEASQHSDQGFDYPCAVCVTSSGRLVVAWRNLRNGQSIVIAYDL